MRILLSNSALALLLLIGKSAAFVPSRPFRRSVFAADSMKELKVLRNKFVLAQGFAKDFDQSQPFASEQEGMELAHNYLSEIVGSAKSAAEYVQYLDGVAASIRAHLEEMEQRPQSVSSLSQQRSDLPNLKDPSEVRAYLTNVEKATTAANDYFNYLEGVIDDVKSKMGQYVLGVPGFAEELESQAVGMVQDLEETVMAAKDYLVYLQDISGSVEAFLAASTDLPSSVAGAPAVASPAPAPAAGGDYLSALGGGPVRKKPARGKPKVATKSMGYLDNMGSATPAPAYSAAPAAPAPPVADNMGGAALRDLESAANTFGNYLTSLGGEPVQKMPPRGKPKVGKSMGASYLDNMGSSAPASSYTASAPAVPAPPPAVPATPAAPAPPAGGDYLSAMGGGGGAPVPKSARGKPKVATAGTSYLDNMGSGAGFAAPPPAVPESVPAPPAPAPAAPAPPAGGDYMSAFSGGEPVPKSARGKPKVAKAGTSYLDNMGSGAGFAAPAPAAPESVPAPPAPAPAARAPPAGGDSTSAIGGGEPVPKSARGKPKVGKSMGASYLDNMSGAAPASSYTAPAPAVPAPSAVLAPETPAAVSAPAPPAGGDYMSALGGGPVQKAPPRGKPKVGKPMGASYLDNMSGAAPASSYTAPAPADPAPAAVMAPAVPAPPAPAPAAPAPPAGGDYMSALGGGPVQKAPPRGKPKVGKSMGASYLDNMSGAALASSYTAPADPAPAAGPAPAIPAPPAPAPAAPAPPAGGDYMSALGGGPVQKAPPRGKPKVGKSMGASYLDNMSGAAPASSYTAPAPADPAPAATEVPLIPVVPAPAAPATPASVPAPAPPAGGDYLSALGGGPVKKMPPRGMPKVASKSIGSSSYLDNMSSTQKSPARGSSAGTGSYLDSMVSSSSSAPRKDPLEGFIMSEALKGGAVEERTDPNVRKLLQLQKAQAESNKPTGWTSRYQQMKDKRAAEAAAQPAKSPNPSLSEMPVEDEGSGGVLFILAVASFLFYELWTGTDFSQQMEQMFQSANVVQVEQASTLPKAVPSTPTVPEITDQVQKVVPKEFQNLDALPTPVPQGLDDLDEVKPEDEWEF